MATFKYTPLEALGTGNNSVLTLLQNSTRNVTYRYYNNDDSDLRIPVVTLVIIAVYIFFGILIGFLNSLTIVAIARRPELKNVTNMFVLSLCCADLLLSPTLIFINFLPTIGRLVGTMWARVIYSLFLSMMFTSSGTSLLSILAIAVDRYFAVLHPYSYRQIVTPTRATFVIVAIWVYCTVLMFSLVAYYISLARPEVFLTLTLLSVILPLPVYLGAVVSQIVICLVASVALYIRIFFALRTLHQKSASLRSRTSGQHDSTESRRTTTTMALVLGGLILSWLPYALVSILTTVDVLEQYNWYIYVSVAAILLLYSNSFMNPIIYAARSAAYRQAYWKVLCCCAGSTGSPVTASKSTTLVSHNDKNGNVAPVDV